MHSPNKIRSFLLYSFGGFLLLIITGFTDLNAQTSNLRSKKIAVADSIKLDSLSLIPNSIIIKAGSVVLDSSVFKINHAEGYLKIDRSKLAIPIDSLEITYRVFPFSFSEPARHKDIKNLTKEGEKIPVYSYNPPKENTDLFKMGGLNKSGSISRGISFGNNQDVVVNSALNLQVAGKLNNNIDILMAATDDNIPIQAEGNTQQLQEFDKVYIQLSNQSSRLIAGDFELKRPDSYFMNYYKRAQGISFSTRYFLNPLATDTIKNARLRTTLSGAVSKGKFARNIIQGIENNQGPYRLRGAENELFIIVLSGSERIYIDGVLLTRGQENDYVIDYNTAEVTFTPRNLITKDKRIIAEFQYSDKNYARSLIHFGQDLTQNKLKVKLNVYSEQDSKNQPLQQDLSPEQKQKLFDIGDRLNEAVVPSFDSIAFSAEEVLYQKADTTVGALTYSDVFIYSTDVSKAFFRVRFSNVGSGNGNYIQIASSANGKVFKWVAPVGNIRQGNFEPVMLLIAPKKKQMATLSGDYSFSKNSRLFIEAAGSNNDINTFSPYSSLDDKGYGFRLIFDDMKNVFRDTSEKAGWKLKTNVNYEMVHKDFSPIERYRSVEFERDWNRPSAINADDQHLLGTSIGLVKINHASLTYHFNSFFEGGNYNGIKHGVSSFFTEKGFRFSGSGSYLETKDTINQTAFLRHAVTVSQKIYLFVAGVREMQEINKFYAGKTNFLQSNSYEFFEWEAFINNADTSVNRYGISYKQRTDNLPKNESLNAATFAEEAGFFFQLNKNPKQQLSGSVRYRTLTIKDNLLTAQKPDNTLVGRLEYSARALKNVFVSNTFYEIGSGLELKKEFSYIRVAAGQGAYAWIDYNEDNIPQLNEFEIAAFPDQAQYIRVFTPTNELVKVYTNQFSQTLNIRPAAIWGGEEKGIKKFTSRFSNLTAYKVDHKTGNDNFEQAYNPFYNFDLNYSAEEQLSAKDKDQISVNSTFRNTLFFNQSDPVFGADVSVNDARNKSLLTNGYDSRYNFFKELRIRWNITQKWSLINSYKDGVKRSASEFFKTRDYNIVYHETEPKFTYQPNASFRSSFIFKYSDKKNTMTDGGQRALQHNYAIELKYNVLSKGSFELRVDYINIKYNAEQNNSLAFEMLDALKTGENYTWSLTWQRTLSNNLQLNLTYDGRKSQGNKPIHTGGAQVRAFF